MGQENKGDVWRMMEFGNSAVTAGVRAAADAKDRKGMGVAFKGLH